MDDEAWKRELVLRARYRESLESRAREGPESSSYNISDETVLGEGLNVFVGWYEAEKTYWGQVVDLINTGVGDEDKVIYAIGDENHCIDSVADLQTGMKEWVTIPEETIEALVRDRLRSELYLEAEGTSLSEKRERTAYFEHLETGPHRMAPGESQLMAELEDARQFQLHDLAESLGDRLVELRARWGPAIWREHIDTCREAGFQDLAESFQAELDRLIPKWEEDLKALDAQAATDTLVYGLEQWADQVAQEEKQMALTPKEISQRMLEADKMRAIQARGMLAKERGEMQDRVGKGVQSACDDIYRRVFEEGWYGRTIHDVIYERQLPGGDKDAVDDQQPGFTDKQKQEIEDIMKTMYGSGQDQNDTPHQGYSQGMEP